MKLVSFAATVHWVLLLVSSSSLALPFTCGPSILNLSCGGTIPVKCCDDTTGTIGLTAVVKSRTIPKSHHVAVMRLSSPATIRHYVPAPSLPPSHLPSHPHRQVIPPAIKVTPASTNSTRMVMLSNSSRHSFPFVFKIQARAS